MSIENLHYTQIQLFQIKLEYFITKKHYDPIFLALPQTIFLKFCCKNVLKVNKIILTK